MATQVHNLPKVPVSPVAVTRLLSRHTRVELEGFVSVAIDLLDVLDGDADNEPDGDELDGNPAEDDFWPHSNWRSEPGCPIADPDEAVDDKGCDPDEGV